MDPQNRQASQRELLEDWIRRYGDRVLRLCFVWLKDVQLAEDAMQDTFLKAWQALPRYERRNEGSDLAFLMRIAANTCRDAKRSAWSRYVARDKALEDLPQSLLAVQDEDRDLFLTILALPERHRLIILMYYYAGLTLQECGEALGIAQSTAHHRLKKAQDLLKHQLEGGLQHA